MDAIEDTDVAVALAWAVLAMTVVGAVIALLQGVGFKDIEETILGGINTMVPALIIIVLAWSIGLVTEVLGTAEYVVSMTEAWMTPALLPFLVFIIAMFIDRKSVV